ncbi:hypothetical protein [Nocardia tengchongensis]|uniref:hypothetical protein n=1 Tax=Nocardia tengchongensis TaxID=2055889 RepID=UPI00365A61B6
MTDYLNDPSAVTQWLDTHRDQFYAELTERLDIEAGLEEVLLTERHNSLIEEIHDKLDIEGGLAAILPAPPLPLPQAAEQPHPLGSLEWASDELARMPLQIRLALRADFAAKLGFAAREVSTLLCQPIDAGRFDAASTRIGALLDRRDPCGQLPVAQWRFATVEEIRNDAGLSDVQKQALIGRYESVDNKDEIIAAVADSGIDMAAESGRTVGRMYQFFMNELVGRLDSTFDLSSMQHWKAVVADYVLLSLDSAHSKVSAFIEIPGVAALTWTSSDWTVKVAESLTELASHLAFLEQMLNDFIGADLREVDLAGVPLEGLRWSEQTTQWPDRWREQIKRDSVHIDDDVYEIHYGTHARGRNTLV